jgi:hypothetical protein
VFEALLVVESIAIIALAVLAVREALYMRRLVKATSSPDLWLIGLLSKVNRRLTIGCLYFGLLVVARLTLGQQAVAWSAPVSGLVLLWLLGTTISIGRELRKAIGPSPVDVGDYVA